MNMAFTYKAYCDLIRLLREKRYPVASYQEAPNMSRCVVLRHDVDTSLEKAVEMAKIEAQEGVKANYFVLLTTDFYNAASQKGQKAIHHLLDLGHEVGLHFDEALYEGLGCEELICAVRREADILSHICGYEISTVSMHRPSPVMLEKDFQIPGLVNVYGRTFFREFKYVSDSRRHWREPVLDVIASGDYDRLHILTHPFWYGEIENSLHDSVERFVNHANQERYDTFRDNITRLEDIMKESEIH